MTAAPSNIEKSILKHFYQNTRAYFSKSQHIKTVQRGKERTICETSPASPDFYNFLRFPRGFRRPKKQSGFCLRFKNRLRDMTHWEITVLITGVKQNNGTK